MSFDIHFLPARYGDSIWIEYGAENALHHILIDGGTACTRADIRRFIGTMPKDKKRFELMVVSHIDRDHIEGVLGLLEENELGFSVDDLWFNGWHHLPDNTECEVLGPLQGERLSSAIRKHKLHWNKAFNGGAVVIMGWNKLPVIKLPGKMKLTLLSPYVTHLEKLKPEWVKELRKNNLDPSFGLRSLDDQPYEYERFGGKQVPDVEKLNNAVFKEDSGKANGSSIAFLAEFEGKIVLFAGDAHPSTILESLNRIYSGKATLDLVKLSHHGSKHNTSPDLIDKLDCRKYVFSTSGSIYQHPDKETVAWIIKRATSGPELIFNYTSAFNDLWDNNELRARFNYGTFYPKDGEVMVVKL